MMTTGFRRKRNGPDQQADGGESSVTLSARRSTKITTSTMRSSSLATRNTNRALRSWSRSWSYLLLSFGILLFWGRMNQSSKLIGDSSPMEVSRTQPAEEASSAPSPGPQSRMNDLMTSDGMVAAVALTETVVDPKTTELDLTVAATKSQEQPKPARKATPNTPMAKVADDAKVAYVISITGCPAVNKTPTAVVDGPAVLAHSIKRLPSRYAYDLIAMVHPNATSCTAHLPVFGYKVVERELGFNRSSLGNKHNYRKYIRYDGCCGEMEFLKLEAYALLEYDVVLHLDTDLLILQPMDGIIDAMIGVNRSGIDVLHKDRPFPDNINFLYTRDYVQMSRWTNETSKFAVQGGFFAIKPDARVYKRLLNTVKKGDFNMRSGWNAKNYGGYYGAPQVQGMLSYFYGEHFKAGAVELNPCIYNSMVSFPPRTSDGRCRYYNYGEGANNMSIAGDSAGDYTNEDNDDTTCQSCSNLSMSELHSTHYTVCYKPWVCPRHKYFGQLCKDTHRAWFEMRRELELSWGMDPPSEADGWNINTTLGYCKGQRSQGYVPMKLPTALHQS